MRECELYAPLKDCFERMSYEVKGEVNSCDLVAIKDATLVVCELKLRLNLDVILQATDRQRMADMVYIAVHDKIPREKYKLLIHLLRRLEIGLFLVDPDKKQPVHLELDATPYSRAQSVNRGSRKRKGLLREFSSRHGDNNTGGINNTKIMTAYREKAVVIAALFARYGDMSAASLRQLGTAKNTYSIITNNHYGWFEKKDKGIYGLTEKGQEAANQNSALALTLLSELDISDKTDEASVGSTKGDDNEA
ncbi:MAG: DUF2161 family putative PD-(D/E)XK-type phosphodiesterase [Eubacteriales bacterium]